MATVESVRAASALEPKQRSLISPWMDFWLLGGASIAFCMLFAIAEPLRGIAPSFEAMLLEIGAASFLLSFVVNFPHFIASYRLAYTREPGFVTNHRLELVAVPVALASTGVIGIVTAVSDTDVAFLGSMGLLAAMAVAMFVTVGWHYVKQIYGCVRVAASFDKYSMPSWQMSVLRYGLFPLWIRALIVVGDATRQFENLDYEWLSSPQLLRDVANVGVAVGAVAIIGAFLGNHRLTGQTPSMRMIVPILAIYVWWVPAARLGFPLPLVPFFHSLQYLPFVAKVEHSKAVDDNNAGGPVTGRSSEPVYRVLGVYTLLVAVGFLAFWLVPSIVDAIVDSKARSGVFAVTIAVAIFINVHHFFIDHVIWRMRDDAKMRDLLLR